ncbi:Low molecular weight phosphotyrosine protein phosphatase [Friedmanniomyces endolithicus]|nr:Low molecular weight phosphotyrosine protein phosphatase [Friedmanniomyces endolithicus]KAK1025660.1 Low molecular weight phosphotyrosine protein phosphatase [Friedmanniomyces endolithicus]
MNDAMDRQDQPPGGQPPKPVSILFVCLGNICRSPMAEGAFRHLTHFGTPQQHPLIAHIDSCGTGAYHAGDLSDTRTMSVLKDNGITDYRHQARKVTIEDFREYDYVLGMDEDNVEDLRDLVKRAAKKGALSGDEAGRIHMYGEFGGKTKGEEIGDPYYGGRDGFEVAYEQVTRFGKALLRHIEVEAAKELGSSVP